MPPVPGNGVRLVDLQQEVELLGIQLVVVVKAVPEERERFGRGATTSGDLGTAVGQRIQSRELLIDPHRVVRAQHGDRAPELDPLRNRRGRRENHRARGGRHLIRVVFANTEVVEPHGIGQGDGLAQIAHSVGRRSEGAALPIPLNIRKAVNT